MRQHGPQEVPWMRPSHASKERSIEPLKPAEINERLRYENQHEPTQRADIAVHVPRLPPPDGDETPDDDDPLSMLLAFGLNQRIINELDRNGCQTIADVRQVDAGAEVLGWVGCGEITRKMIAAAIRELDAKRLRQSK